MRQLYCVQHGTRFDEPEKNGGATLVCPTCERPLRVRKLTSFKEDKSGVADE